MLEYFSHLEKIPSHTAFIQGKLASALRKPDGGDNILFRPMVQTALAEALGKLAGRVSLENAIEELARQESLGQLKRTDRKTPWFGVLCDIDGNMRRKKKNEDLCCQMSQYLLGGGIEDDTDREKLRETFASERQIDPDRGRAIDLNGAEVSRDDVRLPNPWR